MKLRIYFLIFIAALFLHLPTWKMLIAVGGYYAFEQIDLWRDRKLLDRLWEEEVSWEPDPDDPTHELLGGLTRVRLHGDQQIVVNRIGDLLRLYRR